MTVTGITWKHKLMSARSLLYVVIVSEHNLAELRACVHFQPQSIWLITSDRMIKSAQRLHRILEKKLPHSRLEILGHSSELPLKGEFMAEVGVWVTQYLQPRLQQQNTLFIGNVLLHHEELPSTNTYAQELIAKSNQRYCHHQTDSATVYACKRLSKNKIPYNNTQTEQFTAIIHRPHN